MRISLAFTLLSDSPFSTEDFLKKLVPNFWSFLINFLAMIVLFVAVYLIAYKPVKKYLEARKEHVLKNIQEAEEANRLAQRTIANRDAIISEARSEAAAIVAAAKTDAEVRAHEIIAEAQDEAASRLTAADEAIRREEEASRLALRNEIIEVAMDISTAVLPRTLSDEDNRILLDELTDSLDEGEGK